MFQHDGDHHTLTVKNCQRGDAGIYKCIARNREGEDITQAKLDIVKEL